MATTQFIKNLEREFRRNEVPEIQIGDFIKIGLKIQDGSKERTQFFSGTVLAKKNSGYKMCFKIRQILQGIGVERIVFVHSPAVVQIQVLRPFKARRAKLYYIRNRSKKNIRLKQRFN